MLVPLAEILLLGCYSDLYTPFIEVNLPDVSTYITAYLPTHPPTYLHAYLTIPTA